MHERNLLSSDLFVLTYDSEATLGEAAGRIRTTAPGAGIQGLYTAVESLYDNALRLSAAPPGLGYAERALFREVDAVPGERSGQYRPTMGVILVARGPDASATLLHELAHYLWDRDPGYRNSAWLALCALGARQRSLFEAILALGYEGSDLVLADEAQARLASGELLALQRRGGTADSPPPATGELEGLAGTIRGLLRTSLTERGLAPAVRALLRHLTEPASAPSAPDSAPGARCPQGESARVRARRS